MSWTDVLLGLFTLGWSIGGLALIPIVLIGAIILLVWEKHRYEKRP